MYQAFVDLGVAADDTILDIGVTSDQSYDHSNYLEAWYPRKNRITAVGVDRDAAFLVDRYPGLRFVAGDGRQLPFGEKAFDYVHASAVLEHVGSAAEQTRFIAEAWRVARKGVFLTTPNRWFPVEFHTVLPLVHWLPPPIFRTILRWLGRDFFASERNLNLLSGGALRQLCARAGLAGRSEIRSLALGGWASNLVIVMRRPG
jgi:ubiquinone/menaquinone biosynthesis C-methylase UbiE